MKEVGITYSIHTGNVGGTTGHEAPAQQSGSRDKPWSSGLEVPAGDGVAVFTNFGLKAQ